MVKTFLKYVIPCIKAIILLSVYYNYGFLGLLSSLVANSLFYITLDKLTQYHPLVIGDYQFVDDEHVYQAVYILELAKLDANVLENVKSSIYGAFKAYPRLRRKLTYFYFDYFFVDAPLEEAKAQIKYDPSLTLSNRSEITSFANKLSQKPFLEEGFMYDIHIAHTKEGGGVLFINMDHVMTDGAGLMGLIKHISENKMKEVTFKVPLLHWAAAFLNFPIYFFMIFYRHSLSIPSRCDKFSPFKTDEMFTGEGNPVETKTYSFSKAQKFYRSMDITFNDLIVSALSVATQRYYIKEHQGKYKDNKRFYMTMPINLKEIGKQVEMNNSASAVILEVPLGKSITDRSFLHEVKNEIKAIAKNLYMVAGIKFINNAGNYFLPRRFWDFLLTDTLKNVDLHLSNVAGPDSPISIGGSEVTKTSFITPIGRHRIFFGVHSYKGEYFICINKDQSIECDVAAFKQILEEVLDEIEASS